MATAESVLLARNIVMADNTRKFVVVSAPGKGGEYKHKVTDLLISAYAELQNCDKSKSLESVINRFRRLSEELGVDIRKEISVCFTGIIANKRDRDFVVSRGEYLMAVIFSKVLNFAYIGATSLITIKPNGRVDEAATMCNFKHLRVLDMLEYVPGIVMGGFYGSLEGGGGRVKTFARGGGDYSGAIVACMLDACVYENFTDTYGVQSGNPKIVKHAVTIPHLDYALMHKLSKQGAEVIFPECLPLLKKHKIPLIVDNTFDPGKRNTLIDKINVKKKYKDSFFFVTYKRNGGRGEISIVVGEDKVEDVVSAVHDVLTRDS